jgi:monoamine oxidase
MIIGAGLSGLCAAYLLQRAGQRVTVLAARDRPGGRILTLREGFADGLYADAGAGRIADIHHRTLAWIEHFGLALEPMYPDAGRLIGERNGRPIAGTDAARLSSHDIHHILMSVVPWDAQSAELSSARALARNSLIKPIWYRIRGGMDLLSRAFADRLPGAIRYRAAATAIRGDARGVEVISQEPGAEHSWRGDFVVCAVPYTTLRSIRVSPPLPDDNRRIIHECRYESATRVFVQLRDRGWLAPHWSGYGVTPDRWEIWQPSFTANTRRSLLVVYAQGEAAQPFVSLAPEGGSRRRWRASTRCFPASASGGKPRFSSAGTKSRGRSARSTSANCRSTWRSAPRAGYISPAPILPHPDGWTVRWSRRIE